MRKSYGLQVCACGCGRTFMNKNYGRERLYFDASCRKRDNRKRNGETPPAVTLCACGCGKPAIGRRKVYATNACRQRVYRKRKEFDELGPDYDWSERPETPTKGELAGRKIKLWID